jgi:hypothetical protein
MTAHAVFLNKIRHRSRNFLLLPLAGLVVLVAAVGALVAYMLWPSWPTAAIPPDAPAVPVTVAGVIFNVPPAAIRATVQRYPGAHERIDLVLLWPSLAPPSTGVAAARPLVTPGNDAPPAPPSVDARLFVTIAGLGTVLAPAERLRTIYPRYIEPQAVAGPDGLAIVAFRSGTPYESEDLIYVADKPEQFFARCTRAIGTLPGTCIHERSFDAAEVTLRFPREWLQDWRGIAAGFDRLMTQLHPQADDRGRRTDDR